MDLFCTLLWRDYFKKAVDTIPELCSEAIAYLRKYFFSCKWYEVYDFLQFLANYYPDEEENKNFKEFCNSMLKRELSGYRFVGDVIAPITSEQEIAEIEEALTSKDALQPITIHLQSALNLLSDKKSPDYRNSIKESISAIETICKLITKKGKASLSQAIKVITNKIELHSDLQDAFYKLYGYTSDAEGIRHSLMDKPDLDFEDAKFMLVTCSAFANYLKVKAAKAEIELETG
jgi:lipid II:glycine glycyltransferase (peptidoglycan interpeptide bridge formation enzyme)